ncbi:MAG: hypothetical protein ACD_45C00348G0002 [uncultured bacterium]|nr:MAG: hypothetical protein ACD_45C00348G0002 [uncultured bacterium]
MRVLKGVAVLLLFFHSVFAANANSVYTEDKLAVMVLANHPEFIIKLKSNPTTGYSWFLRSYDANLIQPVKHVFEPPADKKLMGASGYDVWTFRIKPAGFVVPQQTVMRFVYARPWTVADDAQQLVFTVTMR